MNETNYKSKYLKYKTKYFNQKGGDPTKTKVILNTEYFKDIHKKFLWFVDFAKANENLLRRTGSDKFKEGFDKYVWQDLREYLHKIGQSGNPELETLSNTFIEIKPKEIYQAVLNNNESEIEKIKGDAILMLFLMENPKNYENLKF